MRAGNDLQNLWPGVGIIQPPAKLDRNYFVRFGKNNFGWPAIILEPCGRIETFRQNEISREEWHLVLRHRRQVVVRRKHEQAGDFSRMSFGNMTGNTGAQRLTHEIDGQVFGERIDGFVSRGKETRDVWRSTARAVTRVFQNVNIDGPCVVNWPGNVAAIESTTAVAVN